MPEASSYSGADTICKKIRFTHFEDLGLPNRKWGLLLRSSRDRVSPTARGRNGTQEAYRRLACKVPAH